MCTAVSHLRPLTKERSNLKNDKISSSTSLHPIERSLTD